MPKLLSFDQLHHRHRHRHHQHKPTTSASALPLFVTDQPNNKPTNMSPFSDSSLTRSYFSVSQLQELELQVLIHRYMLAGAVVPHQLLQQLIKKTLLHSPLSSCCLHSPIQHFCSYYQPSWYWGRTATDPEPGRCRRTDGKKWRCSRDVVSGRKYCERNVHRGHNSSRKHVEIPINISPTTTDISGGSCDGGGSFNGSTKNGQCSTGECI